MKAMIGLVLIGVIAVGCSTVVPKPVDRKPMATARQMKAASALNPAWQAYVASVRDAQKLQGQARIEAMRQALAAFQATNKK